MAVPDAFRSQAIAWLIFFARTDSSVVPRPVGKLGTDSLAVSFAAFRLSTRRLQFRAARGRAAPLRPSPKPMGFGSAEHRAGLKQMTR